MSDQPTQWDIMSKIALDKTLSFKARGIAFYLLSHSVNWKGQVYDMINNSTDGRSAIQSGLKELVEAGYAKLVTRSYGPGKIERHYGIVGFHQTENSSDDNSNDEKTHPTTNPSINVVRTTRSLDSSRKENPTPGCYAAHNGTPEVDGRMIRNLLTTSGMMYFEGDFNRVVDNMVDAFGPNAVAKAAEETAKQHRAKITKGGRGITGPARYMSSILSSNVEAEEPKKMKAVLLEEGA